MQPAMRIAQTAHGLSLRLNDQLYFVYDWQNPLIPLISIDTFHANSIRKNDTLFSGLFGLYSSMDINGINGFCYLFDLKVPFSGIIGPFCQFLLTCN